MNVRNKSIILLLLLIFNLFSSFPQQNSQDKIPLREVLEVLQKRYGVSFSYADNTIKNKYIKLPEENISLSEVLTFLKNTTNLEFELVNDTLIAIRRPIKKNKTKRNFVEFEPLDEVLVQGYLTSGISKNSDGSIDLETDKLGILPGLIEPDVLQIINSFPGVIAVDESISNINIRGGTHDQNLILFDGIRMYKSGHFFGLISAFNPYLDYDINLSKSGSSAKYGESISSVIDMRLPDEVSNKTTTQFGINMINADVLTRIPLSQTAEVQIAARRSITDFANTPTYKQYFNRAFQDSDLSALLNNNSVLVKDENFKFHDIYSKFIWDISRDDRLKVVFLNIENDLSYNQKLTGSTGDLEVRSELNQQSFTSGITYEKQLHDEFKISAQKYFTHYDLSSNNADILNNQNLIQENVVQDNGLKIDADYKFNESSSFLSGYQFSQVAISNLEDVDNPEFRRYIKQVLLSHAAYGQFNYTTDRIQLKTGARLTYFDKFKKFSLEPRVTFNYKFLNNFSLLATGEMKSQSVSQIIDLQEDFLGIEKRRWVLADENTIPIITSKQASLGIFYKKNDLLISGEFYLKNVNDISARSQGFQNQFQFVNDIGNYTVKGFDFLINKRFQNFNTWISYSYNVNNYDFASLNNAESFPNNVDVRSVINIAANYTYNDIKLALGLNWHTGRPFTKPLQSDNTIVRTINFDNPNSSRLADYLRFDASLQYRFKIGNTDASSGISVWSVLDKRNILNTYFDLENNTINQIENTSLRITPNVSFRVYF
ncbi:TonB-dependent receptor plug domain-containing protein [Tenacibaculum sp. MEBiC06402]|uniref:TonB-dependent receptor plug domain-containing protein n=1 Tax=unclassified Tenacibaculum TaxID=2635139 RepID=UPI003B9AB658